MAGPCRTRRIPIRRLLPLRPRPLITSGSRRSVSQPLPPSLRRPPRLPLRLLARRRRRTESRATGGGDSTDRSEPPVRFQEGRRERASVPQPMDGAANQRPTLGAYPAAHAAVSGVHSNAAVPSPAPAGDDWRIQLPPGGRSTIVNKIVETLKKHLPVSVPEGEGLSELHSIAVRFEEKIYTAATNQSDYLRKISLKMLFMESQTETQQNHGNAQVIPNQNPLGPAAGDIGGGDGVQ